MGQGWRVWTLCVVTACGISTVLLVPRISQDPAYHTFADNNTWLGVRHFWNVVSNVPFAIVGIYGCTRLTVTRYLSMHVAWMVFCLGVILVGLGSAYYHSAPSTTALVWDRLPMTVVFMALFAMVIADRVSQKTGRLLLWPLLVLGAVSVAYWHLSELQGRGDLRPYALVQFLPMVLIPLMLILFRAQQMRTSWLWGALLTYALAKAAEHFDRPIYEMTGFLSGHSIKHLLASLAILWVILAFSRTSEVHTT